MMKLISMVSNWIRFIIISVVLTGCVPVAHNHFKDELRSFDSSVLSGKWCKAPVVLLDYSTSLEFIPGPEGNRVKEKEVKWYRINKRDHVSMEQVVLHEQRTLEKPITIKASASYPDGSVWHLYSNEIGIEEEALNNTKYSYFNIPRYQADTIIKVEVEREYLQPEFFGRFFLRDEYPVWHREIQLKYPENVTLINGLVNVSKADYATNTFHEDGYIYVEVSAKKLFGFREPGKTMFPESVYEAYYVSFPPKGLESYSWQELGDHYLEFAKSSYTAASDVQKAASLLKNVVFDEKLEGSFQKVVGQSRYYGDWRGRFAHYPRSASDILENGYGDCKELSTLLKSFLYSISIDSNYVLLSTKGYLQPLEEYPYLGGFNHMILAVKNAEGEIRFMDPTHSWGEVDNSYYDSVGRTALIVKPASSEIITIGAGEGFENRVETKTEVIQSNNQGVVIEGTIDLSGYTALRFYERLKWAGHADVKGFVKKYLVDNFDIHSSSVKLLQSDSRYVKIQYQAPFDESLVQIGAGGLQLKAPSLFKGDVLMNISRKSGDVYLEELTQKDTWNLPFTPSATSAEGYQSYLADCSWKISGKTVERIYNQTRLRESNRKVLEAWNNNVKSSMTSVVWK